MMWLTKTSVVCAVFAIAASGCGRKQSSASEVTDTNTNWLESCDDDATCGELSCLCGRCTKSCRGAEECRRFGDDAICKQPSDSECASPQAICLQAPGATSTATLDAACTGNGCGATFSEPETSASSNGAATSAHSSAATSDSRDTATTTDSSSSDPLATSNSDVNQTTETTTDAISTDDDNCALSEAGMECRGEGVICGSCTNPCQFCNLLRCTDGTWQAMEVFPAPCMECGDALDCNTLDSYCSVVDGATYSCESYPSACSGDHSCACLESEVEGLCSGQDSEFTVASGADIVEQCSCTVRLSGSDWCAEVNGPDGGAYSVEWVCDAQTELSATLDSECTVLATDAARWCCPPAFEPTCQ